MKNKILLTFLIYILFTVHVPAYGETSSQEQDGKSIAFVLEQSIPADSSKNVSLDTEIILLFNKNVVNMSVKENNYNCIKLLDANNNIIPCELIFADDQIEPDKKREIIVRPTSILKENTFYKIEISENMTAKNGSTLGSPVTISFTTLKSSSTSTASESEKTEITNSVKTDNNSELNTSTAPDKNEESAVVSNDISQNASDRSDLSFTSESSLNNSKTTDDSTNSNSQSVNKENTDSNNTLSNNTNSDEANTEDKKPNSNEKNNNYIYISIFAVLLISFIFIFEKFKRKL